MTVPKVSVIIPTIGGPRRAGLNRLLFQIEEQTLCDREVIVIEGENRQGKAINKAAAIARGDTFIILDDDTSLGHKDLFKNMVEALESDKSIGMVGASTIPRPDDSPFQKAAMMQVPRRYYPVVDKITESDMAHHGCCAIPKRVFDKAGGENELLIRGLDPELRFRIRKLSYKIAIAPHSWIYHPLPDTIGGIFRMYFKNGKGAAFAYRTNPDYVYEVGGICDKVPFPQKTGLSYRAIRFARRFLRNLAALKVISLAAMTAYGLGYAVGFFTYKKPPGAHVIYNIRYLFQALKEISGITLKELLVKKDRLFRRYLADRLVLYDPSKLAERFSSKSVLWIHGNSFGDMKIALKLAEALKTERPETAIIASTVELGAYKIAAASGAVDEALFLPFDIPLLIRRAFGKIKPRLFLSIEVILWPNLISEINKIGIKTMLLNGYGLRLDRTAAGYMIPRKLLRKYLSIIDFVGMRSEISVSAAIGLGADKDKTKVSGWLKWDLKPDFPTEEEVEKLAGELSLPEGAEVIVAGCTWRGEEEIFLKAFKEVISAHPLLVMILAPRDIRRAEELCGLIRRFGLIPRKKSLLAGGGVVGRGDVIVLDTLGELYNIYGIAKVSISGGSFVELPGGAHVAEPLLRGSSVVIGPYTWALDNMEEEMNLTKARDYRELAGAIGFLLKNPEKSVLSRDFALEVMSAQRGSVARSVKLITPYF